MKLTYSTGTPYGGAKLQRLGRMVWGICGVGALGLSLAGAQDVSVRISALQEQVIPVPGRVQVADPQPLRRSEQMRRLTGELNALLEGLEGEALRDQAQQSFAAAPQTTARVMLLRAGRSTPPGLAGTRADRRRDRRLEARAWVESSFNQDSKTWSDLVRGILEPGPEIEQSEVLCASLRVIAELGWYEFGPQVALNLEAGDARTAESARSALFVLFGRRFESRAGFEAAWASLQGRDSACLAVSELRALEDRVDELSLEVLDLELAAPVAVASADAGDPVDPARAQRRLDLVRQHFGAGHPQTRVRVAGLVRDAVGRRGLGAEAAVELLIERVANETDPAAFHAVLVVLLELVQGMSAEGATIDRLRAALLDPSVLARLELGDTVVTALSRLPWMATGPHDYAAGIAPSARVLAAMAASEHPVDYDRLHLALAAHAQLCESALQVRSAADQPVVFSLWQVRGYHRRVATHPEDVPEVPPGTPVVPLPPDPGQVLAGLLATQTLPLAVRLDAVAASPYFMELLPLLAALESVHEGSAVTQPERYEIALLDALELAMTHGRFPGQPFLTSFGGYLDRTLASGNADLRRRVIAILANADLEKVLEELPEVPAGQAVPAQRSLRRVLLLFVESRLVTALASADADSQLSLLELLLLVDPTPGRVSGLLSVPVFDDLLDGNRGRPAATSRALLFHLGRASGEPKWIASAESVLARIASEPVAENEPAKALSEHRLRLALDMVSQWPAGSVDRMGVDLRTQVAGWIAERVSYPDWSDLAAPVRHLLLRVYVEQALELKSIDLAQGALGLLQGLPDSASEQAYPLASESSWSAFAGLLETAEAHAAWLALRARLQDFLTPPAPEAEDADGGDSGGDEEGDEGAGVQEGESGAEDGAGNQDEAQKDGEGADGAKEEAE